MLGLTNTANSAPGVMPAVLMLDTKTLLFSKALPLKLNTLLFGEGGPKLTFS